MEVEGSLGLNVDKGTPILRQRGKYSSSEEYVYDQDYRDTVWDDVIVSGGGTERYYFVVKNRWDKVKGVKPIAADTSSGRRWEAAKKTDFIAANSILADMIAAGAITSDKILAGTITSDKLASDFIFTKQIQIGSSSSSINFSVDTNGKMVCKGADVEGTVHATSGSFNGTVTAKNGKDWITINPENKGLFMYTNTIFEVARLGYAKIDDSVFGNLGSLEFRNYYQDSTVGRIKKNAYTVFGFSMHKSYDANIYSDPYAVFSDIKVKVPDLPSGSTAQLASRGIAAGEFVVDTGQNSNGFCMLRIKV